MTKSTILAKKERKAEYERERYKKNKKKILAQQKEYYEDNHDEIRSRREPYVEEYNKAHSVKHGDQRYKKMIERKTDRRYKKVTKKGLGLYSKISGRKHTKKK